MGTAAPRRTLALGIGLAAISIAAGFSACSDSYTVPNANGGGGAATHTTTTGTGGDTVLFDGGGGSCDYTCSNDLKTVIDCTGTVHDTCSPDKGCVNGICVPDPCQAAQASKSSYGCDYYAIKTAQRLQADGACFAVFVANTWDKPAHLVVQRDGNPLQRNGADLPLSQYAYIPSGQGQSVAYAPYDDAAGLGVGEVAVLFLSRLSSGSVVDCPRPAALDEETGVLDTGVGQGFHISSDYPVVAYQMDPYGGGQAGVTSATLLLPTSAWDTNYIAVNAYRAADQTKFKGGFPSLDIIAYKDNTQVTVLPRADITAGPGVAGATANVPVTYTLSAGQFLQITQPAELTGSVIQATEPVGVFGASTCMQAPYDGAAGPGNCDSAQQQIPPVKALGAEYVAVRYRNRGAGAAEESVPYRLVGAVKNTSLTWLPSTPPGAPTALGLGQVVEFSAPGPFTVKSQGADFPFYLGAYMTGGQPFSGEGDPDWVNVIPPQQFLDHYVLFTDPTYPETNLVVVRAPSRSDKTHFEDVVLDCAGGGPQTLGGWVELGGYQYTRVDLVTGDFTSVNGCGNGRQEMTSKLPFGVTVWGWGNTQQTHYVSYAYPAGAGFTPINAVTVHPEPQ